MASKYAKVIDRLPRLLNTEPAYQEKVNAVKVELLKELPRHAIALATHYAALRAAKDAVEEQLSDVNLQLEAISQLLVDQYESEGGTSVKLHDGHTVSVQYEPYAQVVDREPFRLWCVANDLEKALTLPWQTTNAITKERLLAGLAEPDGIKAHARTKIVLRKA